MITDDPNKPTGEEDLIDKQQEKEDQIQRELNLKKFFSFIKQDKPVNIVLCGYFNRIITAFINKRKKQVTEYVYLQDSDVLGYMRKHFYSRSVVECYTRLLAFVNDELDIDDD